MSELNPLPPLPAVQEDPRLPITCPRCNQSFSAKLPKIETVNTHKYSMIVGTHERPVKCPGCGQGFVFAIAEGQALWGVSVVSDVELNQLEPSLIKLVRPGGH